MSTTMRTVSCPHCSAKLTTSAAPEKQVRCPKCQASFLPSSDGASATPVACRACQAKLFLKNVKPQTKFKCPKCGSIERVPAPAVETKVMPAADGAAEEASPPRPAVKPASKKHTKKRVPPASEAESIGSPQATDEGPAPPPEPTWEPAPVQPSTPTAASRTRARHDEDTEPGWRISGKSLTVGLLVVVLLGGVLSAGVGLWSLFQGSPRAAADILKERQSLPLLFLTDKTNQRVIAPGDKLMIVDPKTKELCWPAHACANPDCPGRTNSEPFLFSHPLDLGHFAKDDGSIGYDAVKSAATPRYHGCPKCVEIRNLGKETPAEQALYNSYDKLYELPETASRRARLDEELKQVLAVDPAKK